ncbi:uncharacterized protein LOC130010529 [Patella vulgata]|uniref:uncharacterized protein LOC130010529 n=1 Tax=Patella vulgata TaxID=6465 RepID=UPI0024A9BB20|nr:uncharacterized protein LOC130010529 [Patella vulgata]
MIFYRRFISNNKCVRNITICFCYSLFLSSCSVILHLIDYKLFHVFLLLFAILNVTLFDYKYKQTNHHYINFIRLFLDVYCCYSIINRRMLGLAILFLALKIYLKLGSGWYTRFRYKYVGKIYYLQWYIQQSLALLIRRYGILRVLLKLCTLINSYLNKKTYIHDVYYNWFKCKYKYFRWENLVKNLLSQMISITIILTILYLMIRNSTFVHNLENNIIYIDTSNRLKTNHSVFMRYVGEDVKFECKMEVDKSCQSNVVWFRNGGSIISDSRHVISYNSSNIVNITTLHIYKTILYSTLHVYNIQDVDYGVYTCRFYHCFQQKAIITYWNEHNDNEDWCLRDTKETFHLGEKQFEKKKRYNYSF